MRALVAVKKNAGQTLSTPAPQLEEVEMPNQKLKRTPISPHRDRGIVVFTGATNPCG
jgi:Tfp pilus assembly ATPase PilU